jgi:hypothetical protein
VRGDGERLGNDAVGAPPLGADAASIAAADRMMRQFAGLALANPLFDSFGIWALKRWYFPISRLWAAARVAHGEPAQFHAAVPMQGRLEDSVRLRAALARFEEARAAVNALEAEWLRVFFGADDTAPAYRTAVEAARLNRRHAYNGTRRGFRFMLSRNVPRVKTDIRSPDEADAIYGPAITDFAAAIAPPETMPPVERSRSVAGAIGDDYWIRFKSPSERLGDVVYARVHEPRGAVDPPTIIFGHGVCVEFDHWHGLVDESQALCAAGMRVIRPEAPWHGRRVPPGYFGGERVLGTFPLGIVDAMLGAVREWSVMINWARSTSRGPVVLGGSSLGALTSQLVACAAHDWPEPLRPEALFLITHCGRMADAVLTGALSEMFFTAREVEAKGWTPALAERYISLIDPKRAPAMPPERIVSVLGEKDTITPFVSGKPLVESWGVPAQNTFIWPRGHFSVPMTLIRNDAPTRRFCEIVRALAR